ncbi:hypothetical protein VIGAN_01253300 [Vigna angularis var. angularis]|uniref:Uncharacterized protein n=1 Tax=Vigna angularis var. angularis TaxID=157739 RepID=A0A0S3R2D6_PHAAN|nr:hypothetical protein VIGAN_01253300 [Vigna angularis var. angularis]
MDPFIIGHLAALCTSNYWTTVCSSERMKIAGRMKSAGPSLLDFWMEPRCCPRFFLSCGPCFFVGLVAGCAVRVCASIELAGRSKLPT